MLGLFLQILKMLAKHDWILISKPMWLLKNSQGMLSSILPADYDNV